MEPLHLKLSNGIQVLVTFLPKNKLHRYFLITEKSRHCLEFWIDLSEILTLL
jgi:hypothetical protein